MEKRLNKKIENYIVSFKDDTRQKIISLDFENKQKINELLEYVYDYDRLILSKDDFVKRKRIKNTIPTSNRCNAKRANGEQCTRRRKKDCEYCGTHSKGIPNGSFDSNDINNMNTTKKIEVFAEEIKGIVYYIDNYMNVYKTEDILKGKENPTIVAKYVKNDNIYTIPELGLV